MARVVPRKLGRNCWWYGGGGLCLQRVPSGLAGKDTVSVEKWKSTFLTKGRAKKRPGSEKAHACCGLPEQTAHSCAEGRLDCKTADIGGQVWRVLIANRFGPYWVGNKEPLKAFSWRRGSQGSGWGPCKGKSCTRLAGKEWRKERN